MKNMSKYIIAITLLLLGSIKIKAQQTQERPNILWIVSEDNSPLLGCYGDKFATTPNIDKLATQGVLYENAFCAAPVCAPSRSTLITGMLASSLGTENMRSEYPVPGFVKFFPRYLREAGYYTSNNAKKDYNTIDQPEAWDESSGKATYKNRKPGQPFFAVFNLQVSHESNIHKPLPSLKHDPEKVTIPPYHPRTAEMKHDWAQYYDKLQTMDEQVGQLLQELEEAGLADNTIVFYYSDNGGVLGRSKRFIYESGLNVPLIIRVPEKYSALAPGKPGSRIDRLVSFKDFGPTVLSLVNVKVPAYMQGKPFLGKQQAAPEEYAFGFRGRMDERIDLVRSIRDKKYRYVRNYMPHKIYGQYISYLWQAPSMVSWQKAYQAGQLNQDQSRFWEPKPTEELYDVTTDPHNINNLAGKPEYKQVLEKMRTDNRNYLLQTKDAGFIPEAMLYEIAKTGSIYEYARTEKYPLANILETAEMATTRDASVLNKLTERLNHQNPVVRYWAVTGCIILGPKAAAAKAKLNALLQDPEPAVRIAAAEAISGLGDETKALPVLSQALASNNLHARVQALNILENMGAKARPALPAIRQFASLAKNDKNSILDKRFDYDIRAAQALISKLEATAQK
ncbi:sulfatase-like hydrolase/transferase [Adhaeribacter aerolatus]|nr:sulfatase-like hydrolase/transferase [Adhaeribacter aerolatus]